MERLTGKHILVTGGNGFVGSHIVEALVRSRAEVVVPVRSFSPLSYFASRELHQRVISADCDLKDKERVFEIITKYEIDYIIHLGAQSVVPTAYYNPSETIETNVMGTVNILEATRRYPKVKGVIVTSSDKAYGKSHKSYREQDPLRGDHPYDASKASSDLIAQAYFATYKLPVVTVRFGNIYGPGDLNFSRIIPGIMKSILTGEKLRIRSDGTYVRDYVYVGDVVSGYLFLLHELNRILGEVFNISSNTSFSVIDLVDAVGKILRKKILYVIDNIAVNEIPYQHLDFTKITKLGWKQKFNFKKSIRETYVWYRRYKKDLF